MPPKLPPPPQPDPVTLEQIFDHLTGPLVPVDEKAYHLVALNTVAFQPKVKLFLCEYAPLTPLSSDNNKNNNSSTHKISGVTAESNTHTSKNESRSPITTTAPSAAQEVTDAVTYNRQRRECVIKSIAFMLAQRTSAVSAECRWETVSLLGELCRMTDTHSNNNNNGNNTKPSSKRYATTATSTGVGADLERKLNGYAKANLEYLASLPWFAPACHRIIGDAAHTPSSPSAVTASPRDGDVSPPSRDTIRRRLRERQQHKHDRSAALSSSPMSESSGVPEEEEDEDVKAALRDMLRALPTRKCDTMQSAANNAVAAAKNVQQASEAEWVWSRENVAQAHDLMFLDASTSMLHLIPRVCRGSSAQCAQCGQRKPADATQPLLRCGSCKAVYYCSQDCQKAHWVAVHRVACTAYKAHCAQMLAEYYAMNKKAGQSRGGRSALAKGVQGGEVAILEVPLEPTLLFETRRYLYDHRDASFEDVTFEDYFMQYTV